MVIYEDHMKKYINDRPVLFATTIFVVKNLYWFFRGEMADIEPTAKGLLLYMGPQILILGVFALLLPIFQKFFEKK